MKKLISGMLFVTAMGLSANGLVAQTEPDPPTLEEPCKDKVETQGALIIVTVCERRTSRLAQILDISCDAPALEACVFTNAD